MKQELYFKLADYFKLQYRNRRHYLFTLAQFFLKIERLEKVENFTTILHYFTLRAVKQTTLNFRLHLIIPKKQTLNFFQEKDTFAENNKNENKIKRQTTRFFRLCTDSRKNSEIS